MRMLRMGLRGLKATFWRFSLLWINQLISREILSSRSLRLCLRESRSSRGSQWSRIKLTNTKKSSWQLTKSSRKWLSFNWSTINTRFWTKKTALTRFTLEKPANSKKTTMKNHCSSWWVPTLSRKRIWPRITETLRKISIWWLTSLSTPKLRRTAIMEAKFLTY